MIRTKNSHLSFGFFQIDGYFAQVAWIFLIQGIFAIKFLVADELVKWVDPSDFRLPISCMSDWHLSHCV